MLLLMAWHVVMTRDIALKSCLWLLPKNGDSSRMISSLSLPSDFEGSMCCGPREVKKTGGADFDVVLSAVGLEKRPSWGRTLLRSAAESTPALQLALRSSASDSALSPTTPLGAAGRRGREEQYGFFKTYNQFVVMKL